MASILSFNALSRRTVKSLSKISFHIHFKMFNISDSISYAADGADSAAADDSDNLMYESLDSE